MYLKNYFIPSLFVFISCNVHSSDKKINQNTYVNDGDISENVSASFINEIPLPAGYKRDNPFKNSFAEWLEQIPLKKSSVVYLYDGSEKRNQSAQFAVLDISVGEKNLQQCADAVMRLRAEYLFANKMFDQIQFKDYNGTAYSFLPPYTSKHFKIYLDHVFGMCGSASLSKQLKKVNSFSAIKGGDVIIRGGFPGHAVMVMDVATDSHGNKIYLLAQSYMPAQDIHVLRNPANKKICPWYEVNENDMLTTPEYVFRKNELKEW